MKKVIVIVVLLGLVGCASSGPVPIGNNRYMIAKQSAGGLLVPGAVVKADILTEANTFCAKSGKSMTLVKSEAKNAIPFARMSSAEIQFECSPTP